jgi:aspartate/methionine/tyrosine aminotransferase
MTRRPPPERIRDLSLPERHAILGRSLREAERELEAAPFSGDLLDVTYANTHRFPPPSWALPDFVAAASGAGMTYTPYRGDRVVRSAVAESLSAYLGLGIDPDSGLILTPGSQAALFVALSAIVGQSDRAALVDPDYMSDERILRFLGARVTHVPLTWADEAAPPSIDLAALEAAFRDGATTLVFSNPNNPTGMVLPREVIRKIAELAVRFDATVIVDELYSRLVYDGAVFPHLIAEPGMAERCITLMGPSKTESMSGYRVGVAVGPPELIDRMEDVLGVSVLRAPAYAQHVLTRWLSDDHPFVAARVHEYQALRDRTVETLNASGLVRVRAAQGTAYMFPDATEVGCDEQTIALALKSEAGLLVNPGYQFGPHGARHFRICFAQDEAVWDRAMGRMLATLESLRRGAARAQPGSRAGL